MQPNRQLKCYASSLNSYCLLYMFVHCKTRKDGNKRCAVIWGRTFRGRYYSLHGVQNCCKGDSSCQWNTPILRPQGSKTPEPIDIKLDLGDYVADLTPQANFGVSTLKEARVHIREIVIIRVYFYPPPVTFLLPCVPAQVAPFDPFSWFMAQRRDSAKSESFLRYE